MRLTDVSVEPGLDPRLAVDDIAIEKARVERARVEEAQFETLPELKRRAPKPIDSSIAAVVLPTVVEDAGASAGLDEALLAYVKPDARAFALLRDAPHKRLAYLAKQLSVLGEAGDIASRIIQGQADAFEAIARQRASLIKG